MTLSSCSLINDDSDCTDSANEISFTYDMNLKFADAFDREVKSVTLLGFDADGTLVYANRAKRSEMGADGRTIDVRLAPGEYDFLVWAGDYDKDFAIPTPRVGHSKLTDFTCHLLTADSHPDSPDAPAGATHCSSDLEPLFHSLARLTLGYASPSDPDRHTLNLTKDTNSIRVMLQQQNPESDLSEKDFIFELTDRNSHLNHDNSQHSDADRTPVIYHPHYVSTGTTQYTDPATGRADGETVINVLMAEFTTDRLFAPAGEKDGQATLTVRRASDREVLFSIPLINYFDIIRSLHLRKMDLQEYLDRQDQYSLTFILDKNQQWIATVIEILGWREVIKNESLS